MGHMYGWTEDLSRRQKGEAMEEHGKELWGKEEEMMRERKGEGTCDHRKVSNGSRARSAPEALLERNTAERATHDGIS